MHVLFATDGSEASERAIREAGQLQHDVQRAADLVRAAGAAVQALVRQGDAATRILATASVLIAGRPAPGAGGADLR